MKGRSIVIAEQPELHCTLKYDRVFVKPVPPYQLSWDFWHLYFINESSCLGATRSDLRRSALGFLRTYAYLIKHPSDYRLARAHHLIPHYITYV